jgi:signal transduction histidine kinase
LRAEPSLAYRISGEPLFDTAGALMGYRGRAVRQDESPGEAAPAMPVQPGEGAVVGIFGPELGRRLDQALRQPLGRIIANASTISGQLEGPLRQDYANYAEDIAAAGRHLLELVDDLADLQAIERPGFTTAQEEVDLADLARRAAGLLGVRASARKVRIQTPPLGETAPARGEYRRVLQILVNLVGNAVRHTPEDSVIWVRVDVEDGRAKAIVADQGGGIDPSDHERIFDRFERLGLSGGEGSGLGLYISRRLARAMGGDVMVESALGQGARFTLDLPAWS